MNPIDNNRSIKQNIIKEKKRNVMGWKRNINKANRGITKLRRCL